MNNHPTYEAVAAVLDAVIAQRRNEYAYADLLMRSIGPEAAVAASLRVVEVFLTMLAEEHGADPDRVLNAMRLLVELTR